jgi:hypothetical protein
MNDTPLPRLCALEGCTVDLADVRPNKRYCSDSCKQRATYARSDRHEVAQEHRERLEALPGRPRADPQGHPQPIPSDANCAASRPSSRSCARNGRRGRPACRRNSRVAARSRPPKTSPRGRRRCSRGAAGPTWPASSRPLSGHSEFSTCGPTAPARASRSLVIRRSRRAGPSCSKLTLRPVDRKLRKRLDQVATRADLDRG